MLRFIYFVGVAMGGSAMTDLLNLAHPEHRATPEEIALGFTIAVVACFIGAPSQRTRND